MPLTLALNLSLTGTITVVDEGGGGDVMPLVSSDFKNGVYAIGGVSKTLGQVWEPDEINLGPYDPDDQAPGVGWRLTNATGGFAGRDLKATVETLAALGDFATAGVLGVVTYSLVTGGVGDASIEVLLTDIPDLSNVWGFVALKGDSGTVNNSALNGATTGRGVGDWSGATVSEAETEGTHHAAFIIRANDATFSVAGEPIQQVDLDSDLTPNGLWITLLAIQGAATIEKIEFYSLTDYTAADLPGLSS